MAVSARTVRFRRYPGFGADERVDAGLGGQRRGYRLAQRASGSSSLARTCSTSTMRRRSDPKLTICVKFSAITVISTCAALARFNPMSAWAFEPFTLGFRRGRASTWSRRQGSNDPLLLDSTRARRGPQPKRHGVIEQQIKNRSLRYRVEVAREHREFRLSGRMTASGDRMQTFPAAFARPSS